MMLLSKLPRRILSALDAVMGPGMMWRQADHERKRETGDVTIA